MPVLILSKVNDRNDRMGLPSRGNAPNGGYLVVEVRDQAGRAVNGIKVQFSVAAGDGTFGECAGEWDCGEIIPTGRVETRETNEYGVTVRAVWWQFGQTPGLHVVRAALSDSQAVSFEARILDPSRMKWYNLESVRVGDSLVLEPFEVRPNCTGNGFCGFREGWIGFGEAEPESSTQPFFELQELIMSWDSPDFDDPIVSLFQVSLFGRATPTGNGFALVSATRLPYGPVKPEPRAAQLEEGGRLTIEEGTIGAFDEDGRWRRAALTFVFLRSEVAPPWMR